MIKSVTDLRPYYIPMTGSPVLHRNLHWYATEDDAVLGVVILDLVDHDYSWVVLMNDVEGQGPGFTCVDMKASLPTIEAATAELHTAMERARS